MNEAEFQRGVREAQVDIAKDACRLFFQTRGNWGALFTNLMRDRFNVEVVHVSDITWESKQSYEHGYNSTVRSHVDAKYGAGSCDRAWQEIQEYREESYRSWLASQGRSD